MKLRVSILCLLILMISCKNETVKNEDETISTRRIKLNQEPDSLQSDKSNSPEVVSNSTPEVDSKDYLLSLLKKWNERINDEKYEELAEMYADNVLYYTQEISKEQVIESKREYIAKEYGYYYQELKDIMLELPDDNLNTIRFSFLKRYDGEVKADSVYAKLIFNKRSNGSYEVIKETDILSELKRIKALEAKNLTPGKHEFTYSYLLDTRNTVLAWDNVPYYDNLTINYKGENDIDVSFYSYSGASRTATSFKTRNVTINNGLLNFQGAPMNDATDDKPKEDEYQSFTFKILDSDRVAFIDNNGWFASELGVIFWRVKDK